MSFYATSFIFDSVPSENYNITISSDGEETSAPLSDVDILSTKIWRRPKEFLYGVSQKPVLSFDVTLNTPEELTTEDLNLLSGWLFGKQNYAKLQILQPDMSDIYFNCFFTNPEVVRVGGFIRGVKAKVVCDSPFAYTFPLSTTYNYVSPPSSSQILFDNYSQDNYYLFPTIEITMDSGGGDIEIINTTDNNRTFEFTGLAANEVVTVDNDLQIITSSLALLRLSKFNKKFLRFLKGRNILEVTGDITKLKFTYSFSKKIGG